ncbi:MAG: hypothetical protein U0271_23420 [Polyangiaceae bacterium]
MTSSSTDRTVPWTFALLPLALASFACGSDVVSPPEPPETGELCYAPDVDRQRPEVLGLTVVGDRLWVDLNVDGAIQPLVLEALDAERVVITATPSELSRAALTRTWTHVSGGTYARYGEQNRVDLVVADDPDAPRTAASIFLDSEVSFNRAIGVVGSTLFLCVSNTEGYERRMVSVDVSDPDAPGPLTAVATTACANAVSSRAVGSTWIDWQSYVADGITDTVTVFDLGSPAERLVDYYADEAHFYEYGSLEALTAGASAVAGWFDNLDEMLLLRRTDAGYVVREFTSATRYAAIVGNVAYAIEAGVSDDHARVISFDLADSEGPKQRPDTIELDTDDLAGASMATIAAWDDEHLYLTTFGGEIFVAPRSGSAKVKPLSLYAPPDASCPD